MSPHAQVPIPTTQIAPVESDGPSGLGVWFLDNLTQPAATVLASAGIIIAALITYGVGARNRSQLERHHQASHTLADTQALRDRFTAITVQFADPAPTIRTAAVSALEALADDWIDRDTPREAQACINVLCDYLRTPYDPQSGSPHLRTQTNRTHRTKLNYTDTTYEYPRDDLDTRRAITRTIASHLRSRSDHSWSSFDYNFAHAYFDNADFAGATFGGDSTAFDGATFVGERTSFDRAAFCGGHISFQHAAFVGERTSFSNASFSCTWTGFHRARFGNEVAFDGASFKSERTLFDDATFSGEFTSFGRAVFSGENTRFDDATFGGRRTWFDDVTFGSRLTSFRRVTFSGNDTSFHHTKFTSKRTSFQRVTFSGRRISFEDPQTWVDFDVMMDWNRHPGSAIGPLPAQPASVHPREWPPVPRPAV